MEGVVQTNTESLLSLLIQDLSKDDKYYHIECEPTASVEDLKCLISVVSSIEVEAQVLYYRQEILRVDSQRINELGIENNDMINMGITQLSSTDQDLMNAFFTAAPKAKAAGPKLTQQQLLNQMFHNSQNMRIRQEVEKLRQIFKEDANFRMRLE